MTRRFPHRARPSTSPGLLAVRCLRRIALIAAALLISGARSSASAAESPARIAWVAAQSDCNLVERADYWLCRAVADRNCALSERRDNAFCEGLLNGRCDLLPRGDQRLSFCSGMGRLECDVVPQQGRWNRSLCEAFAREDCNLAERSGYWLCKGMLPGMRAAVMARRSSPAEASGLNPDAAPFFGSISLRYGFGSHPFTRQVEAGGGVKVTEALGPGCTGFVSPAPDFVLDYVAGAPALLISARSTEDVTLVVSLPDGRWACNDDAGGGTDPGIAFDRPLTGRYRVWVGAFERVDHHPATQLTIAEEPSGR